MATEPGADTIPRGQPISQGNLSTIAGAHNVDGIIYLMLVPFGTNSPHMVFFQDTHPIWEDITYQLGMDDPGLIVQSPMLLMGHEINIYTYLKEQYYDNAAYYE
jgi:hypothetical protein